MNRKCQGLGVIVICGQTRPTDAWRLAARNGDGFWLSPTPDNLGAMDAPAVEHTLMQLERGVADLPGDEPLPWQVWQPSFYPRTVICRVGWRSRASGVGTWVYAIHRDRESPLVLDGTNIPIYAFNARHPPRLRATNVASYVRFFFSQVRGKHGFLRIVEGAADLDWSRKDAEAHERVLRIVTPMIVRSRSRGPPFSARAFIQFRDSLIEAEVQVERDGAVSMQGDEVLHIESGLPKSRTPTYPGE